MGQAHQGNQTLGEERLAGAGKAAPPAALKASGPGTQYQPQLVIKAQGLLWELEEPIGLGPAHGS